MRIGIDIRSLLEPFPSGVSEYTYQIVKHLLAIDQENEYLLFCNARRPLARRYQAALAGEHVHLVERRIPNKLFNSWLFFFKKPRMDVLVGGVDVMFLPNFNFISLSPSCRRVVTVHDLSFLQPGFYSLKGRLWHHLVRPDEVIRQADRVIAVSESTRSDLRRLLGCEPRKITVIHSGVEIGRFTPVPQTELQRVKQYYSLEKPFILFLGTVEERKNVEGLLTAWRGSRKRYHLEHQLVIAGALRQTALPSRFPEVTFLSYVPEADKPALYALATAFVYPSFYEGFGLPVIEAMAAGTPVVTSFASSLPAVGQQATLLIDPYNSEELSEALLEIVNNKLLRQTLIQQGKELVRDFTWEKAARETLDVLKSTSN